MGEKSIYCPEETWDMSSNEIKCETVLWEKKITQLTALNFLTWF